MHPLDEPLFPGRHRRRTARFRAAPKQPRRKGWIVRLGRSGRGVARMFCTPESLSREVLGSSWRISGEGAAWRSESRSRRKGSGTDFDRF